MACYMLSMVWPPPSQQLPPETTSPQDLANIKAGSYKLPWDMITPTHRQFNPAFVARKWVLNLGARPAAVNQRGAAVGARCCRRRMRAARFCFGNGLLMPATPPFPPLHPKP
jgi:hypothetical protein